MEWKVGDRFTLEGTVEHADNGYVTVAVGPRKMTYGFHSVDFEGAKVVRPAALESTKLDVTKRMRSKRTGKEVTFVGHLSNGSIVVQRMIDGNPVASVFCEDELENIPEPEEVLECELAVGRVLDGWGLKDTIIRGRNFSQKFAKSRARVTWSESQGWRIEEVEAEA